MSLSKISRITALSVAALLALSACSGGDDAAEPTDSTAATAASEAAATDESSEAASAEGSPDAEASPAAEESSAPAVTPSTDLSAIKVSDTDTPEITFEAPWGIASTTTQVVRPSTQTQKLTEESVVTVNYVGVNGTTGEVFDSSYESGSPLTFALQQVVPGFRLGLSGQTVGSRVLIGMPPEDGYPQGNEAGTINPGDSLLFVVDIISANFDAATGESQAPVEGLPTVAEEDGEPVATIDTAAEVPTELKVAPLIKGPGAAITAESFVQVKYRSWVWSTGEVFEDAWAPQSGRLAGLIEGWKEGLVGQTAGSRVMLVVPPELAYPEGRTQSPPLQPGETLVYVIDILDVQNP